MILSLFAALALATPSTVDPVKWNIDPVHSEVTFRIRHFVSKVPGTFTQWAGSITADPAAVAAGSVEVTIQTASINTGNERRDKHLRSPDFFAADSFPTITFKSTKVQLSGTELKVTGDLTIRGVTKSVVLKGEFGGTAGPAESGKQRIGFTATTRVNRLDYGVKWNMLAEGANILGDDVDITLNIEAVRQ